MLRPALFLACSLASSLPVTAGTASSQFLVQVTLAPAGERCSSETLSQPAQAVVQVVCDSGNFVSIAPGPTTIVGPQSSLFRFYLANASAARTSPLPAQDALLIGQLGSLPELQQSVGTVTGMRVVAESGTDNHFELLISF